MNIRHKKHTKTNTKHSNNLKTISNIDKIARRGFLTKVGSTAAIAPIAGFPLISVAKSPIVLKMQGAWGSKDIMNEFALEYVDRVNIMAEGKLRLDYLSAGAVVKPFELTDAVSKGVLDAGHQVPVYWYGKSKIASLFGSGPINGANSQQMLGWIMRGGGYQLYEKLQKKLGLNIKGFFAFPMPSQPLGWFKKQPPKN